MRPLAPRPRRLLGLALAGALVAGGRANAQPAPPSGIADAGESATLNAVTVVGRAPGPALWRVRRGAGEVVVIGGLSPLPHQLRWNAVRVEAALSGARALLVPPRTEVGPLQGAMLMLRSGAIRLPGSTPLDARLPPALRDRFAAAARVAGQPPARYARWRPAAAGLLLISDFRRTAGLSTAKPGTTLERMAKAQGVPVRTLARLSLTPVFETLASLPDAAQLACLDASVDEVSEEAAGAQAAAQAWSDGRLSEVRAHWSNAVLDRCLLPQTRVQTVLERGTAEAAAEVERALAQPGRTVALVDLHFLLRANGLLDRLAAAGATVDAPP